MKNRIKTLLLCGICSVALLSLSGCSLPGESYQVDSQTGTITVGDAVIITKPDERLQLQTEQNISANGLYYVPWAIGEGEDFVNAEGKNAKLYDAELYFLLGKTASPEKAQEGMDSWVETARENYNILTEETLTINEHEYTVITYTFKDESSPYIGGASAFATSGSNAVCTEFIRRESFPDDAKTMLTDFLENCSYVE